MSRLGRVEMYLGDAIVVGVESSFAPDVGELINIRKITYHVIWRSFTVDHADE